MDKTEFREINLIQSSNNIKKEKKTRDFCLDVCNLARRLPLELWRNQKLNWNRRTAAITLLIFFPVLWRVHPSLDSRTLHFGTFLFLLPLIAFAPNKISLCLRLSRAKQNGIKRTLAPWLISFNIVFARLVHARSIVILSFHFSRRMKQQRHKIYDGGMNRLIYYIISVK